MRALAHPAVGAVVIGPRGGKYERTSSGRLRHLSQAEIHHLEQRVRGVLTPDLLKPEFKRQCAGKPASFGHCYAASEAMYHTLGGKEAGWTPQSIRHEGSPHWFLKHESGKILDPTGDQFKTPVPHDQAVGKGFLTKVPSKRAREIMRRLAVKP